MREIRTYKRDLFSYDSIYLAFDLGDAVCVEICEETPGFKEVLAAMEASFPEIPTTWFMDVAVPAFAANETVLHPFNADEYAALQNERRMAMEREAERRRRWPDVPMIDWLCLAPGLAIFLACVTKGGCHWGWLALPCAVLTVVSSFLIRRVYRVQPSSKRLVAVVTGVLRQHGHPASEIRRQEEELTAHDFWRAVPFTVAVPFTALRLANGLLLLVVLFTTK